MATDPTQRLTIPEYLAFERQSELRHEYLDGDVFAMTGASRIHNLISGNIFGELRSQLKKRSCEIYQDAMRVRTPGGLFTYPDVVAVCGEPRFDDDHFDTLLNPTVLVEVLSTSTASYDRGKKASEYRSIPSLAEHLLVAQDQIWIEHWCRQENGDWKQREFTSLEQTLELPSIGCRLLLADVYERVFA